jgi:hypothetical protein
MTLSRVETLSIGDYQGHREASDGRGCGVPHADSLSGSNRWPSVMDAPRPRTVGRRVHRIATSGIA